MLNGSTNRDRRLDGWKEIAAYLNISIRTAQEHEKQRGLPIRRQSDQDKSRVFAFAAELDDWKTQRVEGSSFNNMAPHAPEVTPNDLVGTPSEINAESNGPNPINRRKWLWASAIGGSAILSLAGLGIALSPNLGRRSAVSYRIEGNNTLIALGKSGEELWRYTFSEQLESPLYQNYPDKYVFTTRENTTIFRKNTVPRDTPHTSSMVCFDRAGKPLWEFSPGKTVTDNIGRQFVPPFWVNGFADLKHVGLKAGHIVVSSNHHWSFPTQVALLEVSSGRMVSEYWHRGHLLHFALVDLDGNGQPQVLLAGVNDAPEYKQATLVVLNPKRLSGSCKDPDGKAYFQGMFPAAERAVIFFPRTPVSRLQEFNRAVSITVVSGRITVVVNEGVAETLTPGVIYEFNYDLTLTNVSLSDDLQSRYLELQDAGKLPKETPEAIAAGLMRSIKMIRS